MWCTRVPHFILKTECLVNYIKSKVAIVTASSSVTRIPWCAKTSVTSAQLNVTGITNEELPYKGYIMIALSSSRTTRKNKSSGCLRRYVTLGSSVVTTLLFVLWVKYMPLKRELSQLPGMYRAHACSTLNPQMPVYLFVCARKM